jgi:myosin heavy subunit
MAELFTTGAYVWVPDEDDCFIPATVLTEFRQGDSGKVITCEEPKETLTLPGKVTANCEVMDGQSLTSVENMVKLNALNDPAILYNLRLRFSQDVIYTYVSTILVAVNPFKMLPIYTPEVLDSYIEKGHRGLDPHVWSIADMAYRTFTETFNDQSIICSGESGAGKTMCMKLVLQYLAEVSSRAGGAGGASGTDASGAPKETLEQKILKANPVMEATGNAKTTRNNNSSRFGKWTAVMFNKNGGIIGGFIEDYLLEKSRVVFQTPEERNYHVFYQMIANGEKDSAWAAQYKLRPASDFEYLKGGVTKVEGIPDLDEFNDLVDAFSALGITETDTIYRLLSGVLYIGNIKFEGYTGGSGDEEARITNPAVLDTVAELLQFPSGEMMKVPLTSRKIGTGEEVYVKYKPKQAADARDALAKALYGNLFIWLISKINISLMDGLGDGTDASSQKIIGVLDIFGFESFEVNTFEQMCINYCNEKLQFHFNEYIFKLEAKEYEAEGIDVATVVFKDNKPTLDLIEYAGKKGKNMGVISTLDNELNVPRGSNEGFLSKIMKEHKKHDNFKVPKKKKKCFTIVHYAGPVTYDVTGWMDKTRDLLHPDLVGMVETSSDALIRSLGSPAVKGASKKKKKKGAQTLGSKFRSQLQQLMKTLNKTEPQFCRCMKPNSKKVGDLFESQMMLEQLRYAGLMEVCRIRQIGFPVRKEFVTFFHRYRPISKSASDHKKLVADIISKGVCGPGTVQVGKTKVFMKNGAHVELEEARETALYGVLTIMQKCLRGFILRCASKRWFEIRQGLKAAIAARNLEQLQEWLDNSSELPFRGTHLDDVKAAHTLKERILAEQRCIAMLTQAIEGQEIPSLEEAVRSATEMSLDTAEGKAKVKEATDLIKHLQLCQATVDELRSAIAAVSYDDVCRLLLKCNELGLNNDEMLQGEALKKRIEEETRINDALKAASAARDVAKLTEVLAEASTLGITGPIVDEATKVRDQLQAEIAATKQLVDAVASNDLDILSPAVAHAQSISLPDCPELAAAVALESKLKKEAEALTAVQSAIDARDASKIKAAVAKATSCGLDKSSTSLLQTAEDLMERLTKEAETKSELKAATKKKDGLKLGAALAKASELGLTGPEVDAATKLMNKLGKSVQLEAAVMKAASGFDVAAIEAAMEAAKAGGVADDSPSFAAAAEGIARIKDQTVVVDELTKKMDCGVDGLDRLEVILSDAREKNLTSQKPDLMAKASAVVDALTKAKNAQANDSAEAADAAVAMAKDGNLGSTVIEACERVKNAIVRKKSLMAELAAALEAKDVPAITAAYEEAQELGLSGDKMDQAKPVVERGNVVRDTYKKLEAATKGLHLVDLNANLEKALELGLEGDIVDAAKAALVAAQAKYDTLGKVFATVKSRQVKMEDTCGVTEADITPIREAMGEVAGKEGITDKDLEPATTLIARMEKWIALQASLVETIEKFDDFPKSDWVDSSGETPVESEPAKEMRKALQDVLDTADEIEASHLEICGQARDAFNALDLNYRQHIDISNLDDSEEDDYEDDEDYDEEEQERRQAEIKAKRDAKMNKAKGQQFKWQNYKRIRSPEDFARGVLLSKSKTKVNQKIWQKAVINRSMLVTDSKDLMKTSQRIHKSILGYCGDKSMAFPGMLANDILNKGLKRPALVDEIYVQICKQLTNNPKKESEYRGWQLLCMCVGCFPPTREFEHYLLNFILAHQKDKGTTGNYANYALRRLEGILESGASGFVPSVDEITAYKERPPILATIELVDGTPLTQDLPVTPDLDVSKVLEICVHFLELEDRRQKQFGIFVVDKEEAKKSTARSRLRGGRNATPLPHADLPRAPRPLRNEDFLGDVFMRKLREKKKYTFVFKRKLYLQDDDEPSEDPMFSRLVYLQAADEIISGNIPIRDEDDMCELTAMTLAVDLGRHFPKIPAKLIDEEFMEYLPKPWRAKHDETEWAMKVLQHRKKVLSIGDEDTLQDAFVEKLKEYDLYGACFFHVKKAECDRNVADLPGNMVAMFNSEGLHFISVESREMLRSFGYADIYRWGGSSRQFSLVIWDQDTEDTFEMTLYTGQAADMAALILDYINAIMDAQ